MQCVLVRPASWNQIIVRSIPETFFGVEYMRQQFDRQITVPLITTIARNRNEPAPIWTARRNPDSLVTDVAFTISPDHVFRGNLTVAARVFKLLPITRLVNPQAREVRRPAGFHPRCAYGVSDVTRLIIVDNRTVSG